MNIIITTKEDLTTILKTVLEEHDRLRESKKEVKLYSINAVAKMLGRSHHTIKAAAESGLIETTADGRIPSWAVEKYLNPNIENHGK